jgi:subtilisin family serine protease
VATLCGLAFSTGAAGQAVGAASAAQGTAALETAASGTAGAVATPPPAGTTQTLPQVLVLLRLPPPHFDPGYAAPGAYANTSGRAGRRAVAAELAQAHGLALLSEWAMPSLGLDCYVLAVPDAQQPAEVAQALTQDPRVEWAQVVSLYHGQDGSATVTGHNDALYPAQPAAAAWHLTALHGVANGRGIEVAVVDSGVDADHPDLAGQVDRVENLVDGRPWVAEAHGTAVAGLIAARADNHVGIAGIAPQARLLALRACWQATARDSPASATGSTLCDSLSLAKALQAALSSDATVINLSLSGPPDRLLGRLIDRALEHGQAVVAAFDGQLPDGGFPASHPGVVAVSDTAPPAGRSGVFSAPGRDVPVPVPGGRWAFVSGSSYAAAQVAGLLALVAQRQRGPGAAGRTVGLISGRARLGAADLVGDGDGGIDACASVFGAAGRGACGSAAAGGSAAAAGPPVATAARW